MNQTPYSEVSFEKEKLSQEIDQILFVCSNIEKIVGNIRLNPNEAIQSSLKGFHLSDENIFRAVEQMESAALLLESMISTQTMLSIKKSNNPMKKAYSRQQLIDLRQTISKKLSDEIRIHLETMSNNEENLYRQTNGIYGHQICHILI